MSAVHSILPQQGLTTIPLPSSRLLQRRPFSSFAPSVSAFHRRDCSYSRIGEPAPGAGPGPPAVQDGHRPSFRESTAFLTWFLPDRADRRRCRPPDICNA